MKPLPYLLLLIVFPAQARGYIDVTPNLGRLINDSDNIALLRVEKVHPGKRLIIYKKIADLKGRQPSEEIKHRITDGLNPSEPALIMSWARAGRLAVAFQNGQVSETCIGNYWYECHVGPSPWWTMTCGQAQLSFVYSGSPGKLRRHVENLLAGREVTITAVQYGANSRYWEKCKHAVAYRGRPQGVDFPICRFKISLQTRGSIYALAQDPKRISKPGAADTEDVPGLIEALKDKDDTLRGEAAADLGSIGPTAKTAVPALTVALADSIPEVQVRAAEALARIDPKDGRGLATLLLLLKAKADVRGEAAAALGNLGVAARPAVPALTALLRDPDSKLRWSAADALGRIGSSAEPAIPALIEAAGDHEIAVSGAAIDALGEIGRPAKAAVPILLKTIESPNRSVKWASALALARIDRTAAQVAVPFFVQELESPDLKNRWHALSVLMALGRSAKRAVPVPVLAPALGDQDTGVRGMAAWILGEIGPGAAETAPTITRLLDDRDAWVREMAAPSLVKILGPKATAAIPILIEGVSDRDADTRKDSLTALKALGPVAREAVHALARAVRDKDQSIRLLAAEALWHVSLDADAVLPSLVKALRDGDKKARIRAARILRRMGPEAEAAVPALTALIDDPDDDVQMAALEAVHELSPEAHAQVADKNANGDVDMLWKVVALLLVAAGIGLAFYRRALRGCCSAGADVPEAAAGQCGPAVIPSSSPSTAS